MMDAFSPLTRRILALGLLILLLLLALRLVLGAVETVGASVSELEDSRFRLARLEAVAARPAAAPAPALPSGLTFTAANAEEAAAAMLAALNGAASQVQLGAVAPLPPDPQNPQLVSLSVSAVAPEANLLAFIRDLEGASPPIRLHMWSIAPSAPGAADLQLQGVAVGAWSAAP